MRLGEILVKQGRISTAELERALRLQESEGGKLGEILVGRGMLSSRDLLEALSLQSGINWVEIVPDEWLDPALVEAIPLEWARAHAMLPVRTAEGRLGILLADLDNLKELDAVSIVLGQEPEPILTTAEGISRSIEKCYYQRGEATGDVVDRIVPVTSGRKTASRKGEDLLESSESAPVTRLVNAILLDAVKAGASDVHLEPFENRIVVRFRIDGVLYQQTVIPKQLESALISRLKVMSKLDIAEKRLPQDGMTRVHVGNRDFDVRVSSIPVLSGERLVLRILNRESALLPLDTLGMPSAIADSFRNVLREPQGAVWVTGPTGSGKTTTLYAALRELDATRINILTIEDPVEYQLENIAQMQVIPKIGLTFAKGLRHILRQDPDVIMVGETRDVETAEIAVRASLTGHLVFSTLHTTDAPGAIIRLADMGIPRYLLAAATRAVLAQRLVRKLCRHCRRQREPSPGDLRMLGFDQMLRKDLLLWEPDGCPQCLEGFSGRIGVYEMIQVDGEWREAIRSMTGLDGLRSLMSEKGLPRMMDDAADKVRAGLTSLGEVLRALGSADVA